MRAAIILLSFLLCAPVLAQAPGATPPRGPAPPPPAAGSAGVPAGPAGLDARRERIKKRIRALRAYTLTEELDLDEQTAGKLFPILSRYDDDFDKLLQQRAEIVRRLDRTKSVKDPTAIDREIDAAAANQRAFWDLESKRLVELRKILAPAQTARLLIVLPALERRIENQLRKAIESAKAGPGGPAGNDDDDIEPDERPKQKPKPKAKPPDSSCDPFGSKHGC